MNMTNFTTVKTILSTIENEVVLVDSTINTLKSANIDVSTKYYIANKALTDSNSKVVALTTTVSGLTTEKNTLTNTVTNLTTERDVLNKKITTLQNSTVTPTTIPTSSDSTIFIANGSDLDTKIKDIKSKVTDVNAKVKIQIDAGTFLTNGFAPGLNWEISGKGIDVTNLVLRDVGSTGFHHPNHYVIATANYGGKDPSWNNTFKLTYVTLDANWPIQSARTMSSVKYGGVYIQATDIVFERIKVINWGSNGLNVDFSEAFPIFGVTYSDEKTHILIQDCIVEKQFLYNGGYATAIMVQTMQPGAGDRIPYKTRKSESALIRRNRVYGVTGHGYGCGFSENVLFDNNDCVDSKTGVNIDTGNNRGIKFTNNKFMLCNQGIHFGNAYSFEFIDFEIKNNYFFITTPFYNAYINPPKSEYAYGVRVSGNTTNAIISGNKVKSGCKLSTYTDGIYGMAYAGNNSFLNINPDNVYDGINTGVINNPPFYTT